jgi:CubicO group peptidase (beta-lactamase class C family)
MTATCLHVLIDRGLIDVDAPVAKYWPEFAHNGKGAVTVAMLMSHQAGLPLWEQELPKDALLDWALVTNALAEQAPIWEPGTGHGYHGMTLGFLEGELVRRVTGRSLGTFLRDEIANPLGADVWIGLPESEENRVAEVILSDFSASAVYAKMMAEPDWVGTKMFTNVGDAFSPGNIDARSYHAAEAPATGGLASARGLARLYAPLSVDGSVDGVRIVRPTALPGMRNIRSASSCDLMLRLATTFTLGFSKSWGARKDGPGNYAIIGEHAFGAPGMGGSMAFADGEARLSFGYTMNQCGGGVGLNDRGQSLIDAAYSARGYSSHKPGFWVR